MLPDSYHSFLSLFNHFFTLLSSFTFNKRPFSYSSLSAIRVVSSAYLRLLIFLPAIFIPTSISFSPAFHMRYSACKVNKQGDNTTVTHRVTESSLDVLLSPFGTSCCSMSSSVSSWIAYRFPKRQVRWSGILISWRIFQFVVIHTVKGFSVINEAEVYIFLEFPCFIYDPTDVDNLISGSSFLNTACNSGSSWFT